MREQGRILGVVASAALLGTLLASCTSVPSGTKSAPPPRKAVAVAPAPKRAAETGLDADLALFKTVENATKASLLERFMKDHPQPRLVLLAKIRIAEIDFKDLETENPFRPARSGNRSWPDYVNVYAFGDYLTLPDDPVLRTRYYDKVHPLLIQALAQLNSLEGWIHYLKTYPDNPHFKQAAAEVEKFLAARANKWEGYDMLQTYLALYDEVLKQPCPNRNALIRAYEDALVDTVEKEGTVEQFDRYLKAFPNSPHLKKIQLDKDHVAFREAREGSNRAKLKTLIDRYRSNPNPVAQADVREAIAYLERLEHKDVTSAGIPKDMRDFIERYKGNDWAKLIPDVQQRLDRMHNQMLIKAKAAGTAQLYRKFLESFPDSPEKADVARRLEEAEFKEATTSRDRDRIRAVLAQYPSSPFREKGVNRIDDLDFEEIRTQSLGEPSTAPLQRYLERRPPGIHVTEAEALIVKLNQHHADYLRELERARESGNVSRLSTWIVDNQGNVFAARHGQRDLDNLRRELAVHQLIADLTTSAGQQSRGVLSVVPTRLVTENAQALAYVETNTGGSTGFFFGREGLLLTNARVVRSADPKRIVARLGGRSFNCQVVSVAPADNGDLAVLHAEGQYDTIPMGNPNNLSPNEKVVCLATRGVKMESAEGTYLGAKRAGGAEWLVIQCPKINAALGGVIVNQKARAVGLLVRPEQVDPAVKENLPDCVYGVSMQTALPLLEKAIRGQ